MSQVGNQITATARRGIVEVTGALTAAIYNFSVMAPGFKKWLPNGNFMFGCTNANMDAWNERCADIDIIDADGSLARLNSHVVPPIVDKRIVVEPAGPLWRHQQRMISMSLQRQSFGIFHDMGTGKSATALLIGCELFKRKAIQQMLFVTTTNNVSQFMGEQIPMHKPGNVQVHSVRLPHTKPISAYIGDIFVVGVCGHGAFQGAGSFAKIMEFVDRGTTLLVIDESTGFKGWSTKRIDNALKLRDRVPYCYLMSGEPAPNGLEDLFTQFYLLDPNILGHASITSFRNEYCVMGGLHNSQVLDYKNKDRLYSKIANHCEFVNIKDCHDMPEQIFVEKKYEPTKEQRRVYNEILDLWLAILDSGDEKNIETAAAKYVALQTISNGWLKLDDGSVSHVSDGRAKMVCEEILNVDKAIVWCRFHEDIAIMQKTLKVPYVTFYGGNAVKDNTLARMQFQEDPACRVFLATAASGGTALNLQVSHHQVFFSNSYNYSDRSQAERRTWRSGQTERCVYVDVIGLPIDRQILTNLRQKRDLSREIRTIAGMKALAAQLREMPL